MMVRTAVMSVVMSVLCDDFLMSVLCDDFLYVFKGGGFAAAGARLRAAASGRPRRALSASSPIYLPRKYSAVRPT